MSDFWYRGGRSIGKTQAMIFEIYAKAVVFRQTVTLATASEIETIGWLDRLDAHPDRNKVTIEQHESYITVGPVTGEGPHPNCKCRIEPN